MSITEPLQSSHRSRQARYRATAKGQEAEQRYRHSIPGRKAGADAAARYRTRKAQAELVPGGTGDLDLDAMLQE